MKKISLFRLSSRLLVKNLGFVYWHIAGVIIWLQGLIILGGFAIAFLDKKPIGETMYLAFITALTIGYGDLTPQSGWAKLVAICIGFIGIIVTGLAVAASIRALEMTVEQQSYNNNKQAG